MLIYHYGSLNALEGGPAYSTAFSILAAQKYGHICEILSRPLPSNGKLLTDKIKIHYLSSTCTELKKLPLPDVYHIQGLWHPQGHYVCSWAQKHKVPYVIALRGMLYPQALHNGSYWKKWLALHLFQQKDLQNAACIQATCTQEMEYYRELSFTNPVAIVPNAVKIPEKFPELPDRGDTFTVGYLGRLHPRKQVEQLIYAIASPKLKALHCRLYIIGKGEPEYEKFLRMEVQRLNLDNVVFPGFLVGEEKTAMLRRLSILAVPSDFENFGNIIPEALMQGIPVMASRGTPWQELENFHCGWWFHNTPDEIVRIIAEAAQMSPETLRQWGRNGQQLLKERYSEERHGVLLDEMYQWVAHCGAKPSHVFLQ